MKGQGTGERIPTFRPEVRWRAGGGTRARGLRRAGKAWGRGGRETVRLI